MIVAVIVSMAFLVGILYYLIRHLPPIKDMEFEILLNSIKPIIRGNAISLHTCDTLSYLNITYYFVNDVFFEFDMDMGSRETPTERQLQITRDYFNEYLKQ
jgi:hypothetical protein